MIIRFTNNLGFEFDPWRRRRRWPCCCVNVLLYYSRGGASGSPERLPHLWPSCRSILIRAGLGGVWEAKEVDVRRFRAASTLLLLQTTSVFFFSGFVSTLFTQRVFRTRTSRGIKPSPKFGLLRFENLKIQEPILVWFGVGSVFGLGCYILLKEW